MVSLPATGTGLLLTRVDVDIAYGVLYYLETSDISRIPAIRNDIIHMIIKRNELACYVRDRIELPPILKEDFKCQKCYAQEPCFLYDNLVEGGKGEQLNKKAKERYDELVKPLKPSHQEFMRKWDTLLTKEETDMMKFRRELWTMLSTEREKLGRCFSNVVLEAGSGHEEKDGQKINRYSYTFTKQRPKPGFSFTESQLIIGEPVVVSDEQGHFALANGYVTNVKKRRITVAVDRRLHNSRIKLPGFDSQNNQTFAGIMEVGKEGEPVPEYEADEEPVLYRLDKDEFSNGMAAARNNLIQIMDDSVYKARDLRELIVDSRAPIFRPLPGEVALPRASQVSMNSDQKAPRSCPREIMLWSSVCQEQAKRPPSPILSEPLWRRVRVSFSPPTRTQLWTIFCSRSIVTRLVSYVWERRPKFILTFENLQH
jgi:DNA replication ATP-dependent helicase Dna2